MLHIGADFGIFRLAWEIRGYIQFIQGVLNQNAAPSSPHYPKLSHAAA